MLRVFITQVEQNTKGSSAQAVNDLETVAVGQYDDTILGLIDNLAAEAHARGSSSLLPAYLLVIKSWSHRYQTCHRNA